jgi:hypothetical protein
MAAITPEDTPALAPAPAAQGPDRVEGFVVLSTWQSFEVPGVALDQPIGNIGSYSDTAGAVATPQRAQQFTRQIMVTRLLLRIYSAESGTKPDAQQERYAGWLVIQL